ncbi:MAG: lysozyme inhibitor LprI family protein [Pseudomonadota bacterium]
MKALAIAALLAATPAAAQTQAAMNAQAAAAYKRADAAMSAAWRVAYAGMKARDARDRSRGGGFGYAAALLESQRAWLKFRDAQCVIEGGEFAGGSMQGMATAQCRTRLTTTRLQELRAFRWAR